MCCSGLGGSSGCAPSAHQEAPGDAPGLPCFFALQVQAWWEWGQTPPPIVMDKEEEYEVKALLAHGVRQGTRLYLLKDAEMGFASTQTVCFVLKVDLYRA